MTSDVLSVAAATYDGGSKTEVEQRLKKAGSPDRYPTPIAMGYGCIFISISSGAQYI